jgi:hypothetical protein
MTTRIIDKAHVMQAYSGRPGCACGCRGTYHVASAFAARVEKERGYSTGRAPNDAQVSRIVNLLNRSDLTKFEDDLAFAEINGRAYCVYFDAPR